MRIAKLNFVNLFPPQSAQISYAWEAQQDWQQVIDFDLHDPQIRGIGPARTTSMSPPHPSHRILRVTVAATGEVLRSGHSQGCSTSAPLLWLTLIQGADFRLLELRRLIITPRTVSTYVLPCFPDLFRLFPGGALLL